MIWNYSPLGELRSISGIKVSLDDNSFSVTNSNCNRKLLYSRLLDQFYSQSLFHFYFLQPKFCRFISVIWANSAFFVFNEFLSSITGRVLRKSKWKCDWRHRGGYFIKLWARIQWGCFFCLQPLWCIKSLIDIVIIALSLGIIVGLILTGPTNKELYQYV